MHFDFALILVVLTSVTGVVWGIDSLFFAKGRSKFQSPDQPPREPVLVEYSRSFFPVLLIVLLFRSFLAEPFRIPSGSMMPTLLVGDFILVNKFAYGIRLPVVDKKIIEIGEPSRGDVVVFRYPEDPRQDYIKRVIGLPGDEISYHDRTLYVNGKEVVQDRVGLYDGNDSEARGLIHDGAESLVEHLDGVDHAIIEIPTRPRIREGTWNVPAGHYFVMGDNRDNSQDSRFWGFVPEQNLVGKAFVIWMSWRGLDNGWVEFGRLGKLIK
ncbi:signal peptidase I [Tahibacter amnicola]|uniref:Signal peptidase I n=1 Tax=Tahibacter amnicola TaxID=2976241 RepID=A0ABY6BIS7_9GAMM|nr:signal peptidase I [Tahibacter amnicola]UXI69662.1 signal peptidase I [Tahibacter amnicola]